MRPLCPHIEKENIEMHKTCIKSHWKRISSYKKVISPINSNYHSTFPPSRESRDVLSATNRGCYMIGCFCTLGLWAAAWVNRTTVMVLSTAVDLNYSSSTLTQFKRKLLQFLEELTYQFKLSYLKSPFLCIDYLRGISAHVDIRFL